MKTLRVSDRFGEQVVLSLASDLGIPPEITECDLERFREEAFAARTSNEFATGYLREQVFSKWAHGVGVDKAEVALRKARIAEHNCSSTNCRLAQAWPGEYHARPHLDSRFKRAREIVGRILGQFSLAELVKSGSFSPGACTSLKRSASYLQNKWVLSSHVTEGALRYALAFAHYQGVDRSFTVVPGNRITTVAKSWKTDRVIAVEPDWNMFFQKGVGTMIRRRLQRYGLLKGSSKDGHFPEAQEWARKLAKAGSGHGLLATLDLSAASDSVSLGLVELLLPEDWLKVLYDLRSPRAEDGTCYEKISSMGNGFTFELETLLFYALTWATSSKRSYIHVYGDDIICPSDIAGDAAFLLFEAGFELNDDKSFVEGPFRESCGGHYFAGDDVTPFYVKDYPQHVGDLIVLHNKILAWRYRHNGIDFSDTLRLLRSRIPRSFYGPSGTDGVAWAPWDRAVPQYCRDFQAFKVKRLIPVTTRDETCCPDQNIDPDTGVADILPVKASLFQEGGMMQALWSGSDWRGQSQFQRPLKGRYRAGLYYVDRHGWCEPEVW